jgi:adenylate kinase
MLRDRIKSGAAAGTPMEAKMQAGALVADHVVNAMVETRLSDADAAKGFILDGYPRTVDQAEHFAGWLEERRIPEVVIHLAVDYNVIIARLTGRRQCPRCGTLYNMSTQPPKQDGLCDKDGEKLMIRDDDKEAVIRGRLEAYDRQTRPVLEFFKTNGHRVEVVDASYAPPIEIFNRIRQAIGSNDRS